MRPGLWRPYRCRRRRCRHWAVPLLLANRVGLHRSLYVCRTSMCWPSWRRRKSRSRSCRRVLVLVQLHLWPTFANRACRMHLPGTAPRAAMSRSGALCGAVSLVPPAAALLHASSCAASALLCAGTHGRPRSEQQQHRVPKARAGGVRHPGENFELVVGCRLRALSCRRRCCHRRTPAVAAAAAPAAASSCCLQLPMFCAVGVAHVLSGAQLVLPLNLCHHLSFSRLGSCGRVCGLQGY